MDTPTRRWTEPHPRICPRLESLGSRRCRGTAFAGVLFASPYLRTVDPLPSTEGIAAGPSDGREKAVVAEVDRRQDNDDAGSVRDSVAACCLGRRNACTHAAPGSLVNRPPARWAGRPFAGISGYDRLPAGISGRFACGIHAGCKKGRRSTGEKRCRFAGIFTGATGLEPATSGVTGRRSNQLNYAPVRAAV